MGKTTISFYPVGCGDCVLLELDKGPKMMWDCNFRKDAEDDDKEEVYDVLDDLLNNKLTAKKKWLPFFANLRPELDGLGVCVITTGTRHKSYVINVE